MLTFLLRAPGGTYIDFFIFPLCRPPCPRTFDQLLNRVEIYMDLHTLLGKVLVDVHIRLRVRLTGQLVCITEVTLSDMSGLTST